MIAFGVNFSFYYLLLTKNFYEAFHLEEVGAYLAIILCAGLAITWQIEPRYGNFEEALRVAYFQVGSIITTTGFSTVDFDLWPSFSKTILVMLMIIGACAGSTGGGVKVSRVVLVMKSIKQELRQIIHPHGDVYKRQIFESFQITLTVETLQKGLLSLFVASSVEVLSLIISNVAFRFCKKDEIPIMRYGTLVSNSGFAGLPVIENGYGLDGLFYASLYIIPTRILMWSAGISLFTTAPRWERIKRVLFNPGIIAVELGLLRMLFEPDLPLVAVSAIHALSLIHISF